MTATRANKKFELLQYKKVCDHLKAAEETMLHLDGGQIDTEGIRTAARDVWKKIIATTKDLDMDHEELMNFWLYGH